MRLNPRPARSRVEHLQIFCAELPGPICKNQIQSFEPPSVTCAQEQLERDGARVKIMTDHLVNVQQDGKELQVSILKRRN